MILSCFGLVRFLLCRSSVGDQYALQTGYNEVAELNQMVVLYPQTRIIPDNPLGCWDWWGYTNENYGKRHQERSNLRRKYINAESIYIKSDLVF